ncbi:Putative regulatory subunit OS=Gemmata sp. Wa1-1 PE=4 SV=1: LRR_6 [Gemmataceae bacterium]|nr:Putative regulatory subunit OS=Gemmata sp. Wa1-1 PE=4 SV=1: LRR_6 [Gemmataceae bacterium]VTU02840.1 Putative regulatory subunit OS=Gemmata sp. Wa1-1 PE=4 SV=1: LRR_6 [Gemmataceae bacterium]
MTRSLLLLALAGTAGGCSRAPEDRAEALVRRLGGSVARDDRLPGAPVVSVHLRETACTDADLKQLTALTHLVSLNLSKTQVTDTGMQEVHHFKELRTLAVRETAVTDAGLRVIAQLPNLTSLYVGGANVTRAGIDEFLKTRPTCEISE